MINKTLTRTTILPASKNEVFRRLKELKTLQHIASPYATFTPENDNGNLVWEESAVYYFYFKLFGLFPFGVHKIEVISFSENGDIYTHEQNSHVSIWNHRIILKQINQNATQYTDEVEIGAGWKTPFIYLWAKAFYSHRQRKWIKLLADSKK